MATVAEVIVKTLQAAGVKHCWGVPGDTLVMPPFIGAQQAFGTALYSAKAMLGGRAGDVWDLVTENL
jgi:hypothetical protein